MVVGNFVMFRDGGKQHMYACLRMNEIHGNNVVSTAYSHVDKYYYSLPKSKSHLNSIYVTVQAAAGAQSTYELLFRQWDWCCPPSLQETN